MEDALRQCVEQLQEANTVGSLWRSKCISMEASEEQSAARIAALEHVVKSLQDAAAGSSANKKKEGVQLR
jgi:hypothetical protein